MSAFRHSVVVVGIAASALSMSACGHKTHKATSAATTKAAAMSSSTSSKTHTAAGKSAVGNSTSDVTATIGGEVKHIHSGQMCSHKHANDYKKYGFSCVADGKSYVLKKD